MPTHQPAAIYTDEDFRRVVARDHPPGSRAEAAEILALYGKETWHRDPVRVRMACLKLAAGDLAELRRHVQVACVDYRDVLAIAEYPLYLRAKDAAERARAIAADWDDLQAWLHRK